jgi:hypothetical protein
MNENKNNKRSNNVMSVSMEANQSEHLYSLNTI